jgi:hypothetical protein
MSKRKILTTQAHRIGWLSYFAVLLSALLIAACAGPEVIVPAMPVPTTTAIAENVSQPTPLPSLTPEPSPTATSVPTPEPTVTLEPTPVPVVGEINEQHQWWDGASWQELPETEGEVQIELADGQVRAIDEQGTVYHNVGGEWLTESQVEAQKVARYVMEETEPINHVAMSRLEFRASDRLQGAIWERLPADVQERSPKPLFLIVPDVEKLQAVIDGLSLHVVGQEEKVPLADKNVVFTFLSADEDEFDLPYYGGWNTLVTYGWGAFKGKDEVVYIVIQTAPYVSTVYSYDDLLEWHMVFEGVFLGLQKLATAQTYLPGNTVKVFQRRFFFDSEYDNEWLGNGKNHTSMLFPIVGQPTRGDGFLLLRLLQDHVEWIPEEHLWILN